MTFIDELNLVAQQLDDLSSRPFLKYPQRKALCQALEIVESLVAEICDEDKQLELLSPPDRFTFDHLHRCKKCSIEVECDDLQCHELYDSICPVCSDENEKAQG